MNEAWTTALGRELQQLTAEGADFNTIYSLEHRLQAAFNTLKHIRRCYHKPCHDHLSQD